jgi:hypothetical protein
MRLDDCLGVFYFTRCEFVYHIQAGRKKARVVGWQRSLSGRPCIGAAKGVI